MNSLRKLNYGTASADKAVLTEWVSGHQAVKMRQKQCGTNRTKIPDGAAMQVRLSSHSKYILCNAESKHTPITSFIHVHKVFKQDLNQICGSFKEWPILNYKVKYPAWLSKQTLLFHFHGLSCVAAPLDLSNPIHIWTNYSRTTLVR